MGTGITIERTNKTVGKSIQEKEEKEVVVRGSKRRKNE
jgi:hypothetical protein